MPTFVLPTADLVREFGYFDELFCFYEGGVRGVVKDTILLSDPVQLSKMVQCRYMNSVRLAEGLIDKILFQYTQTPEALFLQHIGKPSQSSYIEMVAESIDRKVADMLKAIFPTCYFNFSPRYWRWSGDDLLALVRFTEREIYYDA